MAISRVQAGALEAAWQASAPLNPPPCSTPQPVHQPVPTRPSTHLACRMPSKSCLLSFSTHSSAMEC